jgi:hypothetical protein
MNINKFFFKYGGCLVKHSHDDCEFGDFLFLHPNDLDNLKKYQNNKYQIVQRFENNVIMDCSFEDSNDKIGYYVIKKNPQ